MSLESQKKFLTEQYSIPLFCPACRGKHSVLEIEPDYLDTTGNKFKPLFCPATKEEIIHKIGLFAGEQWFSLKEKETLT
jgi:hypothetical protein